MPHRRELSEDRKQEILDMVVAECARAIGFDNVNAGELIEQRERALNYAKGVMPDLVMQLNGRSKVVSTDVADAIETALPDLIDIFTGDDDAITFAPVNDEDIAAAAQEEEYLRQVVFQKNAGWLTIYEAFKDALTCKTGVLAWRWDGEFEPPTEYHQGENILDMLKAKSEGEITNIEHSVDPDSGQVVFSYEFVPKNAKGRVVIEAVAPEDLAVAADTKTLATATYCAVRQRPRAQDLLAMGYDPEVIDVLPPWNNSATQPEMTARDTVDESLVVGTAPEDLRQVEIYRHYIRVYEKDEKRFCLYQVLTGGFSFTGMLIDIEEVSRVQLAAITPYINPHRFYGESVADKLMEIQKIKSSLMRMALDAGYFALNQRMEVDEGGATADTISDLLNNEPGMPIRVKRSGTIKPLSTGELDYDPLEHLEYFDTVAEKRTGIVRNAQGLNPDTLHDTKGGLEILNTNAQKRLRLIARTFAETGYKDFLVNLHATIRENGASMRDTIRLRNQWVAIDPSTWRQRDDMVIQIGTGAGGRDHDVAVAGQIGMIQEKLIEAQQLPDGPLVNKGNLYQAATFAISKLGVKSPEKYISDPAQFQSPPNAGPPPNPDMVKVQGELQLKQQQLQADTANKAAQTQVDAQHKQATAQTQAQAVALQHQRESEAAAQQAYLKQYQIDSEIELKRQQNAAQLLQSQQQFEAELASRERIATTKVESSRLGGDPG